MMRDYIYLEKKRHERPLEKAIDKLSQTVSDKELFSRLTICTKCCRRIKVENKRNETT